MAFNGLLITVGNYNIPLNFIKEDSYSAYRNVQDLDSYRDANGLLHRTTVEHVPIKIEFETMPLNNIDYETLMTGIRNNYSIVNERKASVVAYVPEINDYVTQDMYIAQPQPKIKSINVKTKTIEYNPIKFSFIGY